MINDVSLHLSGAFFKSWERRWDQEWVKVDGGLTQEIKTWRDELQRSASARHQDRVRCRGGRGTTGLSLEIPSVGRLYASSRMGLPRAAAPTRGPELAVLGLAVAKPKGGYKPTNAGWVLIGNRGRAFQPT